MTNEEKARDICRGYNYYGRLTPQGVAGFAVDRCREMAKWKDEQYKWHKCTEEKPKEDGKYLVCMNNDYICTLTYEVRTDYWSCLGYQSDVKYWMKIPNPPKE